MDQAESGRFQSPHTFDRAFRPLGGHFHFVYRSVLMDLDRFRTDVPAVFAVMGGTMIENIIAVPYLFNRAVIIPGGRVAARIINDDPLLFIWPKRGIAYRVAEAGRPSP